MKLNEIELRQLTENGLTNKEIADILGVSRATITRNKTLYGIRSKFNTIKHELKECISCKEKFDALISENRKFCSHSCSTTFNNLEKGKQSVIDYNITCNEEKLYKNCINCENNYVIDRREMSKIRKFCSGKCHKEFESKDKIIRIENGDISLHGKQYKKYLILKYGNECMKCGWNEINITSGKVPVELEHIDGNSENNKLENLKLLCPNCHSLTPTYKALNKGNGRYKRMERYNKGKSF